MTKFSRDSWLQIQPIIDEALDLAPEARTRWLSQLAQQHPPDVIEKVSALLAEQSSADRHDFLREVRVDVDLAGLELGPYRLERLLGQGGMGTVWLAQRSDGRFEGRAAIKLLHLSCVDPAGQRRFRREGTVLARLAHPGIAKLLDAGVSPSGQPYLVLEYVEGSPIDVFAQEHALARTARIELFLRVLAAVQHAHTNLVIHRDLKPSNILVSDDGAIKLLDFGIAKLLDNPDVGLSVEGYAFTPRYAAPEQVRAEALTTATDVYALGVLLYMLLSGRHPTCEDASTSAECLDAVLGVEPAKLGLGDLDNVLAKALRKAPAERYPSVAALEEDLGRYLRQEPVKARPPSVWYALERFVRRHWAGLALTTLTAAVLIGVSVFALLQMQEAQRQEERALQEKRLADAQVEFQNVLLSSIGERALSMRQILDLGRDVLEKQHARDPTVLVTLLLQLARYYADLGDRVAHRDVLRRAEALAVSGAARAFLPQIRCELADNLRLNGDYPDAWKALAAAESLLTASSEPGQRAACLTVRSALASEVADSTPDRPDLSRTAIDSAQRALEILDRQGDTHSMRYLLLIDRLAMAYNASGEARRAVALYRRSIDFLDDTGRGTLLVRAENQHDLGCSLLELGETEAAERTFSAALDHAGRSGTQHVAWQYRIHLGEAALMQAHFERALEQFRAVVERALLEGSLYWEGRGLFGIARVQALTGHLDEAHAAGARLGAIIASYPHVLETEDMMPSVDVVEGLIARASGDQTASYERFRAALRSGGYDQGKFFVRHRPVVLMAAEAALATGLHVQALRLAREALQIARLDDLCDLRSAYVGEARLVEGRCLLATGDRTAARASFDEARVALRAGAGASHPLTLEVERQP